MLPKRLFIPLALLIGLSLACNLPAAGMINLPTSLPTAGNTGGTSGPIGTATATPFMPAGPSETADPLTPSPEPSPTPDYTPTPVPLINRYSRPQGQVNILLLGSDFRPGAGFRTDVILLLILDPKQGKASVISFPRDLYVLIPGWKYQRINTAMQWGGFESMVDTLETNFGVTADYYFMTNFSGFRAIVNTLGGITINASKGLSDLCDLPQADSTGYCYVSPGQHPMDGDTALWYVRSRYSTSDFDRLRRAQEVIQGIFIKMLSLNALARGPELYELFKDAVDTNMGARSMLTLLPFAGQLQDLDRIDRYSVSQEYVTSTVTEGGAQVLVPHTDQIFDEIISKAAYNQ